MSALDYTAPLDQSVTATSALTETSGARALLRVGSSPYEFLSLVYDATYGKWVGASVPLLTQINAAVSTGVGTSYTTLGAADMTTGDVVAYRAFYDAGARLQFRLKCLLAPGSGTLFLQLNGAEYSVNDTGATSVFSACEIQQATGANSFEVSAWTEPTPWTPADDHLRVVAQVKVSSGSAGSLNQTYAEYRWVAAA